jgi:hypothetical protein
MMATSIKDLPLDGVASLLSKVADSYLSLSNNKDVCPNKQIYKVASRDESYSVSNKARQAALKELNSKRQELVKFAFDTRRIDQENDRNPRTNLQHWHRQDEFIDEEDQNKINIFAKLLVPLNELKEKFGADPDWHESYARVLLDTVNRILRIKQGDGEFFRPQMAYLEQLLDARYRLRLEDIQKKSADELRDVIIKKDENLIKRGIYRVTNAKIGANELMKKDGNMALTQESIVNAIFGNNAIRREGEKTVERTITITIRDQVIDE